MGTKITLTTADGTTIGAYKADPADRATAGIVVVQEIFGVNHHIRSIADRLAAAGYAAIAPALFDFAEPGVELAYDADGGARGMALAKAIKPAQMEQAVDAAIAALVPGPVGIVGFCLGGSLAYGAATRNASLKAAVGFYGGNIAKMLGPKLLCPTELHFGEKDDHIPMSDVDAIRTALPDVPIFTYPAGHGFNCDERGSYHKESADLAWARMLAFFGHELR